MGYLLCGVISALYVCRAVYAATVADANGEFEWERQMSHCESGVWGAYFLVLFLHCTCAVLYLLQMRQIWAACESVRNGCDSATVKYAARTLRCYLFAATVRCCVCLECDGSFLSVSNVLLLVPRTFFCLFTR